MIKLKSTMTFEEMTAHMKENSFKIPNRVTVGNYAKMMGYRVYKPVVKGKRLHLYVNEKIKEY